MAAITEKQEVSRRYPPESLIPGASVDDGEFGLGYIVSGWNFC
jgi:hypothetical protein